MIRPHQWYQSPGWATQTLDSESRKGGRISVKKSRETEIFVFESRKKINRNPNPNLEKSGGGDLPGPCVPAVAPLCGGDGRRRSPERGAEKYPHGPEHLLGARGGPRTGRRQRLARRRARPPYGERARQRGSRSGAAVSSSPGHGRRLSCQREESGERRREKCN